MWSLSGSQAIDQWISSFGPGLCEAGWSPALGLSRAGQGGRFGPESHGPWVCCFGPVGGAASLISWCAPTRSSGVGARPGFLVWASTWLIWVWATGLEVSARAACPMFTIQGLRGEGRQRPWLLPEFSN